MYNQSVGIKVPRPTDDQESFLFHYVNVNTNICAFLYPKPMAIWKLKKQIYSFFQA